MERLPQELLQAIISHLNQRNQLKCILVCRYWYQIIVETVLHKEVCLYQPSTLQHFKDIKSNKVQTLVVLHTSYIPDAEIVKVQNTFPTIKSLRWQLITASTRSLDTMHFKSWSHNLENLTDLSGSLLTTTLLEHDICNRLTELFVSITWREKTEQAIYQRFLDVLPHAPHIKTLEIDDAPVRLLKDLTQIHAALPQLQSLSLLNVSMYPNEDNVFDPFMVVSANKLASFVLKYAFEAYISIEEETVVTESWLWYIGYHYKNLETLVLNSYERLFEGNLYYLNEDRCIDMLVELKHLHTYSNNLLPLSQNVMDVLESNNVQLKEVVVPFVSVDQLEKQLRLIQPSTATSSIKVMEMQSYNLEDMDFSNIYQVISQEPSIHQLTNLTLSFYTFKDQQNTPSFFLDVLYLLPSLTSFNIKFMCFNDYMYTETDWLDSRLDRFSNFKSRLKSLALIGDYDLYKDLAQQNTLQKFFDLIFTSCQDLQLFEIVGNIQHGSTCCNTPLTLNMAHLTRLKDVTLHIQGAHAYRFNNQPSRRDRMWINYHIPYKQENYPTKKDVMPVELNVEVDMDQVMAMEFANVACDRRFFF